MKKYDLYQNKEPVNIYGSYGRLEVTIPAFSTGCIMYPGSKDRLPVIAWMSEGEEHRTCCSKNRLLRLPGNAERQEIFKLLDALDACIKHSRFNILPEVNGEHDALSNLWLTIYNLRFLPTAEAIRENLRKWLVNTEYQDRIEQWYGKETNAHTKSLYNACLRHHAFLQEVIRLFLETGKVTRRLCNFREAHDFAGDEESATLKLR